MHKSAGAHFTLSLVLQHFYSVFFVTLAGDNCEECEVGYYGDAVDGVPAEACHECPCYQPRVVNATCALTNSTSGDVDCLHCNDGYTGPLCDQ